MRTSLETLFDPFADADGPPPETLGAFMRWLLAGTRPAVLLLGLASLALGVAEAVAAWLVGWVVDTAREATATGTIDTFFADHGLALVLAVLFFVTVRPVLMILSSGVTSLSLGPGLFDLGVWRLHRHTLGQSLSYFENDFAGRISQKQVQTGNSLSTVVTEFLNAIAYGLAAVIGAAAFLGAADWRLLAALAIWFASYIVLIVYFLPRIRVRSRHRANMKSELSGQLVDSISHMETVKLFAHAGREEAAALESFQRYRTSQLEFGRMVWTFRALLTTLGGLLPAVMLGLSLWLWQGGETTIGTVAMAALLASRLSQMTGWISFTAMNIFADIGVIEDGMKTLAPPHALVDRPGARDPDRVAGHIAFHDVAFRYGRKSGGGLHGINFGVLPGEKVGLVGPSGAGKSTAVALLARLHDVEEGRIEIDGQDIRDFTQDGLRRQIATVTQETALFNRPALDNILYGRPDAGEEAAMEAASRAAAHDFISSIVDHRGRTGYAAHLGERGVKLSGGQRQRIAIARAILKDAPVLVLDEATSALDSEVEAEIQAALARLMEGKTVLAIAHRLSTLQSMDRIIVLDQGRIVEEGTHDALLAEGGLYARLWQRQSGAFIPITAASAAE